jgi:hypothetical protein
MCCESIGQCLRVRGELIVSYLFDLLTERLIFVSFQFEGLIEMLRFVIHLK